MINVIIERVVDPTMLDVFRQTLLQTRRLALESPGYLSGESFMDVERQNHWYIMSSWETLDDWKQWQSSGARHEMLLAFKAMLVEPEKITVTECTR